MIQKRVLFSVCFLVLMASAFSGHTAGAAPKRPAGSVIVPDRFLRQWDPVTIFFSKDRGPAPNAPEDNPGRFVTLSPDHPGAYTWLDRRTLQFRPSEPWPPLTRFKWRVEGRTLELDTLMSTPVRTIPGANAEGLEPVETFTMTFPEPLDPEALARMITISLRPLPGVEEDQTRWLDKNDFTVKVMERKSRSDAATYVLLFNHPIPMGTHAVVHMRLSLADKVDEAFYRIAFSTAEPFTATRFGCGERFYPVTRQGVSYAREQAIECSPYQQTVAVEFSGRPKDLGPVEARNLVRFTPGVENLKFNTAGSRLNISGSFKTDTLYQVMLEPAHLKDEHDRVLQMTAPSKLFLYFPAQPEFLQWDKSQGIVERYGPQMVPLTGRGFERLDLRIHAVDPLDRSFWPFPGTPIVINETERPPGPGETPSPFTDPDNHISPHMLAGQIKALGSPAISQIVSLPLRKSGGAARFGLDLAPYLSGISGKSTPGTYLVGMRKLDQSTDRSWIRVQVTDLCLTTVEEPKRVKFIVTSLSTGKPVSNATIKVEGSKYISRNYVWKEVVKGNTDSMGAFYWKNPGNQGFDIRRIVVAKDDDMLVMDPGRPPDEYADNTWISSENTWLQWTQGSLDGRSEPEKTLCHMFTERPVYKPDDPVHIKGYIRKVRDGSFSNITGKGYVVVNGPGDLEWRYPVEVTSMGSFYHLFNEEKLPTGEYRAWFENNNGTYGSVYFSKEAYRLPKFEVLLHGPDVTGLDAAFTVKLTAEYYAGGRVNNQPVRWRITQFPYTWTPKKLDGFIYSTDARFSGEKVFRSTPVREQEAPTDVQGGASVVIDPTIEATAQPRRYVIEATVTGADDQTVSSTFQVKALPSFVLGLKAPRYLQDVRSIDPEIIAQGPDGKLLAGREITVRLLQRQWHSHLQADDFSRNAARYVTDIVDEKIHETRITSTDKPRKINLPIKSSGVYIIELESQDKLGRTQVVSMDLFAGGREPVTWSRPPSRVFKVTAEKPEYTPGETATLLLESPFQKARALVVVEHPDGKNVYDWVTVGKGTGTYKLPLDKPFMPRIPVHFLLMRERTGSGKSRSPDTPDLEKPATMAATVWVNVSTAKHRVTADLTYPPKAQPGDEITVDIQLKGDMGQPVSGEVTLWLVDQSVLALGEEQPLDPLRDFIAHRSSHIRFHDTRNLTLGYLPFQEAPGGGMREAEEASPLLEKVTVRKTFDPVPYYNPGIMVGSDGKASINIKLPDNLTNFKIRAKVVSGKDRFGFAEGHLSIRLPVIVQPSFPRFVRPGDTFTAIGIGRIVEGGGGPGKSQIRVQGLILEGPDRKAMEWVENTPLRIEYTLQVPTPGYTKDGKPDHDTVDITLGVERTQDQARDAFSLTLPVQYDRKPVVKRKIEDLKTDKPVAFDAVTEPFRPGTYRRAVLVSEQPALIKMAAGLDYLLSYPHGCTEQRISAARAQIAARRFRDLLSQTESTDSIENAVTQTLAWVEQVADDNGLAAYWPGSSGNVSLTAWCVQFMVEAKASGFQVNDTLLDNMIRALKRSLRSDYANYIRGADYAERCWALIALADAGEPDSSYASELARKSDYLDLESQAQVARVLFRSGEPDAPVIKTMTQKMWDGIVFRLYQGKEIYGGLQENASSRIALILPSETRTLSQVLQALTMIPVDNTARRDLLTDGLVTLGRDDGWGSTNADCEALLALSAVMNAEKSKKAETALQKVTVRVADDTQTLSLSNKQPMQHIADVSGSEIRLSVEDPAPKKVLVVRSVTQYLPKADGSMVSAFSQGFVVNRELLKIKKTDLPPERIALDTAGKTIQLKVGDIIEEHIELVNPKDRHYVAVVIPLAAGMEPMNPNLATAPPEAAPSGRLTTSPTYVAFMDDQMGYYYNTLPKGTYHFYFRTRATIPGQYIQPAAFAEMMYNQAVNGNTNGAKVVVVK